MRQYVVTLDRYTRCVLTALAALLTIITIELWVGRPSDLPAARAQIPDTGLQRLQQIEESRKTNRLLEEILEHLKTKPILVTFGADEKKSPEKPPPPPRRRQR